MSMHCLQIIQYLCSIFNTYVHTDVIGCIFIIIIVVFHIYIFSDELLRVCLK
jgi:hypothetical protein